jgi:uncharacterized membrane protein
MIKSSYKSYADGLLFVLNIFLLFLLVFGSDLVVPRWLQPVGRMHPLILHFPIVILMMGVIFEYFRFRPAFKDEALYQNFATSLLLIGCLLAALTAIMGLFLSREPGYTGNILQWHKWTGASVVFVSSIIYWCRNADWYRQVIARSGAVLTMLCLILAGHYGADITHGEDFLLAPVMQNNTKVPIDQALVYKDVIQPIFNAKCISCHNDDKVKGGLMLTDEASILKGGKTGKLFVPGNPQVSLILQRIHLPEDDKDHMPPTGKPQLTATEMALVYLWIKENADFKKKVITLPKTDSLRVLAATLLQPAATAEDNFDFAAADDKTIKKLNNNYRVVYAIAKGSPALAVNIYNKASYTPSVLTDLSDIKKQVVSLNLSKMPVKDAELKIIAQFENLRELNLNFTDITGSGLNYLIPLKHLSSLSLAGTNLNAQDFKKIIAIKSLTKLAVWDTGLKDEEIQQLKKANKNIAFEEGFKDNGKPIKLNVPQFKNTQSVFSKPFVLNIAHPIKGVDIRYTTDGTDPDSVKSLLYKPGIMISDNTTIKARAYKKGWYGSDVVSAAYNKSLYTPDSVSFLSSVGAIDPKLLTDNDLGTFNFLDGKWVGTQKDEDVYMQFKKPVNLTSVGVNCMRNTGAQIFFPMEIEVWGGADKNKMKRMGGMKIANPLKNDPVVVKAMICKLSAAANISYLRVLVKPLPKLPVWDKAKDKPYIFVDELFFN